MMPAAPRYIVDGPKVTPDEATELMVYHLMLAHTYYQASEEATNEEVLRRTMVDQQEHQPEIAEIGVAWLQAMDAYYAKLKAEQDQQDA